MHLPRVNQIIKREQEHLVLFLFIFFLQFSLSALPAFHCKLNFSIYCHPQLRFIPTINLYSFLLLFIIIIDCHLASLILFLYFHFFKVFQNFNFLIAFLFHFISILLFIALKYYFPFQMIFLQKAY